MLFIGLRKQLSVNDLSQYKPVNKIIQLKVGIFNYAITLYRPKIS